MLPKNNPYPECATCQTLEDCKHVEVAEDYLGSPLPPECCLKPLDIMKATLKKHKTTHKLIKEN